MRILAPQIINKFCNRFCFEWNSCYILLAELAALPYATRPAPTAAIEAIPKGEAIIIYILVLISGANNTKCRTRFEERKMAKINPQNLG